jgi:hypothetical protein
MSFTQHWFEGLGLKNFENLKNIIDIKKSINFLEIGCYEGNCHLWMYQNILLNSDSKSVVIEPFGNGTGNSTHSDVYNIFTQNLQKYIDKITILRGISNDMLPSLNNNNYDIIYIDGDHTSEQTYKDGILAWPLLKNGGIMIFDDYLWHGVRGIDLPIDFPDMYTTMKLCIGEVDHPALGINNFLKEKDGEYLLLGEKEGFNPECKIIDFDKLHNDKEYQQNYRNNFNYQIWIRKL